MQKTQFMFLNCWGRKDVEEVNKKNLSFQEIMFAVYWVLLTFLWDYLKKTKGLF